MVMVVTFQLFFISSLFFLIKLRTKYSLVLLSFYRQNKDSRVFRERLSFHFVKNVFFFISDVSTFLQKPLSLSAKQPQLAISAMMVLVGLTIVANSIEAALNDCNAAVS